MVVAGSGFEPLIYGLWARRDLLATPPRYNKSTLTEFFVMILNL